MKDQKDKKEVSKKQEEKEKKPPKKEELVRIYIYSNNHYIYSQHHILSLCNDFKINSRKTEVFQRRNKKSTIC